MRELTVIQSVNYASVPFATPTTQINYWTELLSYTLLENITALKTAGFAFEQAEDTDFSTMETDFDTYLGTLNTWLETSVGVASAGVGTIDAVPAIIPIAGGVLAKIAGNPLLVFVAKLAINVGLKLLEKKLNPATDMDEMSKILREMLYSNSEGKGLGELFGEFAETAVNTKDSIEGIAYNSDQLVTNTAGIKNNIQSLKLDLQGIMDEANYIRLGVNAIGDTLYDINEDRLQYDGIGLVEALMKIGLDKVSPGIYTSIVSKLQQTPTRICLTYGGQVDDVTWQ